MSLNDGLKNCENNGHSIDECFEELLSLSDGMDGRPDMGMLVEQ